MKHKAQDKEKARRKAWHWGHHKVERDRKRCQKTGHRKHRRDWREDD